MSVPVRAAALASTAMLLALPAHAASVSFGDSAAGPTENSGTLSVPQFDSSLGTLLSVDWLIEGGFDSDVTLFNSGRLAQTVNATLDMEVLLGNVTPGTFTVSDQLATASTGEVSVPGLGFADVDLDDDFSTGATETTDLAGWIGDDSVSFDFSTLTELDVAGGEDIVTGQDSTTANLSFTVTYNFADDSTVIPLPAAGWMLLTAIAGLGGAGWYRRRNA